MYLSAGGGGGSTVAANQRNPSSWETFRLWKLSPNNEFKIRTDQGQFLSLDKNGNLVATVTSPKQAEMFRIISNGDRIRIEASNNKFLQVQQDGSVKANDEPGGSWGDSNPSVFQINITKQMGGDMQFCSFHGPDHAVELLQEHWSTFIVEDDFSFISSKGLNAVRIPVAWWIMNDSKTPSCHPPNYPGYQAALDKAFDWADKYSLGVIVDLHAAPWSQNGKAHSASRDGTVGWGDANIDHTVQVIEALTARYALRKSLLAIELLNEPLAPKVGLHTLKRYYTAGYKAVQAKVQRPDVYIIMSNRLNISDPTELVSFTSNFSNCVLDVHYYNLYDEHKFGTMNWMQNIDFVKTNRLNQLKSLMRANGALVFVGEWAAEWMVNGATSEQYRKFADAQMDVYGQASFGWAYWT